MDDLGGTLMRLDLADLSEAALADNVLRACAVTGDTLYFVSALDQTALMRLEIGADAQATATQVATASGNIASLHCCPKAWSPCWTRGRARFCITTAPGRLPNTPATCPPPRPIRTRRFCA